MTKEDKGTTTSDPIFAAIAAHRSAWVAVMAAMDRADAPLARKQGRTVTPADVEAKERADRALDDAMDALKHTQPVTMAGLGAAIAYLIEWDEGQMGADARAGIQALLRTPLFEVKPRKNVAWDTTLDFGSTRRPPPQRLDARTPQPPSTGSTTPAFRSSTQQLSPISEVL
jgi:hypothetical protein